MTVLSKSVIALIDDIELQKAMAAALADVVKTVVFATSDAEAYQKTKNQPFDCVILRTKKRTLSDPNRFYQQLSALKGMKAVPWIVLGTDIEDEKLILSRPNLKFISKYDAEAMQKIMHGLFYDPKASSSGIDVSFINPFVEAVVNTIETMAQLKLSRGTPKVRGAGPDDFASAIAGTIDMNSDRFNGSMTIRFQEKVILAIFSKMMGEQTTAINDDVRDSVAELTNIIFGNARRDLNTIGHTIAPAIPSIVVGAPKADKPADEMCLIIPFNLEQGEMRVECRLKKKRAA